MKRIISIFLSFVMVLSVFSCLSVVAGASSGETTFEFAKPLVIAEQTNGFWKRDTIWNDETDSNEEVMYFHYYEPNIYAEGNTITYYSEDGNCEVYVSDGFDFYNEDGWCLMLDFSTDQSYENQWTIGSDNYMYIYIEEDTVKIPVTIVENPYESIEFIPGETVEVVENTNGYTAYDYVYNPETEEYENMPYFYYYTPEVFVNGSKVVINYKNGTKDVYNYSYSQYVNSEGEVINLEVYADQNYDSKWSIGSENFVTVKVKEIGMTTRMPVTVIENPVASISFYTSTQYKYIENSNGYFEEWYNPATKKWENKYFYNTYYNNEEEDVLTVNYKNGVTKNYSYSYDSGYWIDSEGKKLPFGEPQIYDEQGKSPWTVGGDNYMIVDYLNHKTKISVSVEANPYESIEFTPVKPVEVIEKTNGYWTSDWIWDESIEDSVEKKYYRYDVRDLLRAEGNKITVKFTDGTEDVYVCDGWGYYNESYDNLEWSCISEQSWDNQLTLGSDNSVILEAFGKQTQVQINVVESPYVAVEFVPVGSLAIGEYTHGSWMTDDVGAFFSYSVRDVVYKENNVIKLIKNDGTTEDFICNGWDYTNSNEESLTFEISAEPMNWGPDKENVITIESMGVSCDVKLTINKNNDVVFEEKFVAEKVSEDSCVITEINCFDDYNVEEISVPEKINGYTVVGVEDGVFSRVGSLRVLNLPSTFAIISEKVFAYCDELKEINVSEDNPRFASVNGILYNKALTDILHFPASFTGDFIIKAGVKELPADAIARLDYVSSIEIESGNTAFAIDDGVLYSYDFTKIYKAISVDDNFVMKSTVKEIADYSFSNNTTLKSVVFAPGVTEISYAAFENCTALTSVDLPESLVSIEKFAFRWNTSLLSVDLPESTRSIADSAFFNCKSLSGITLNNGLESMGNSVFYRAAVEKIVLPDSLTQMGGSCFMANNNLSDVTIGKGLTEIPYNTFYECGALKNIDIPENITVIGSGAFSFSGLTSISLHNKITAIDGAFSCCNGLKEVEVVDSVVSMNSAFSSCKNLTYASVGSGVKSMNFAFAHCDNLEKVDLAEGISGSSQFAFKNCKKLQNVDIPSTVTEISYAQFSGCETIDAIDIPDNVYKVDARSLEKTKWYNNQPNGDVYLEHVLYTYKGAMPENYNLVLKTGTKAIAQSALENRVNLVSVEFPDGFKYIGEYAFDGCKNLKSVTIPDSVEYIGEYSFGYTYNGGRNIFKYKDFTIYGIENSTAEKYAKENGFEFVSLSHMHTEGEWIVDKAATCTEKGSKHKECTTCGEELETAIIEAKGHKAVKDPAVKASCTKAGKTEGSHCSVCNEVLVAQEIIPATGHTEVKDPAVKATCTKAGKTEGSHCSVCKAVIKAQKTVAKKGHTASNWIVSKKATVNAAGSKYQKCTVCGVKLKTAKIAQLKCAAPKLKAVSNVATGIKLTWNKVTGADKYEIYRKTGNGAWKKLATVKGTVTTYTDKTAKSGTTYKYTVKAKNEAGLSGYNTTGLTIKCLADPVLKAPTSTKKGITLKWNKVTGAQGYVVYRKAGNGKLVKLATVKGVSKISYTDKSAKKGTKYTYQIKAYSGKTYSAYSNAKTIKDKY